MRENEKVKAIFAYLRSDVGSTDKVEIITQNLPHFHLLCFHCLFSDSTGKVNVPAPLTRLDQRTVICDLIPLFRGC
jgi:hypothetical protein